MIIVVKIPQILVTPFLITKDLSKDFKLENERCGIIVGKRKKNQILITNLIEDESPRLKDPFQVFRETSHIYPDLINSIKKNSEIDYLGEWHTHPNGPMRASIVDHISMKEMINNPIYGNIYWAILLLFLPEQKIVVYYYDSEYSKKIKLKIV